MSNATDSTAGTHPLSAEKAIKLVGLIALLSILLGFAMQGLIVFARMTSGGSSDGPRFLADLTHGVSWSFLVCAGIGIGTALTRARASLVGLIGLVCAPVGMALAKSSQKVVSGLVGAASQPAVLSLATISVLRAVEYGVLGWLLATLLRKGTATVRPFLLAGLAIGILFGGAICAITFQIAASSGAPLEAPRIAATLVNELAMPIGCAVVIYIGQVVSRGMQALNGATAT